MVRYVILCEIQILTGVIEMRRSGVGLLVLVLLGGCTSGGEEEPAPALREAWSLDLFRPVGQAVVLGDVVVVYGTVGQDLLLFGVSAADGSPATTLPRSIAPSLGAKVGERTVLAMADRLVAYDPPLPAPA
jgi:multisubunit Na+/H+ antiporter MnhC subunit